MIRKLRFIDSKLTAACSLETTPLIFSIQILHPHRELLIDSYWPWFRRIFSIMCIWSDCISSLLPEYIHLRFKLNIYKHSPSKYTVQSRLVPRYSSRPSLRDFTAMLIQFFTRGSPASSEEQNSRVIVLIDIELCHFVGSRGNKPRLILIFPPPQDSNYRLPHARSVSFGAAEWE